MYADIEINEDWIQSWEKLDDEMYKGLFDIEENCGHNGETTNKTANELHVSHENVQLNADSSDSDTNDIEGGKHSQTNEEEKEDMLALEENCKLRDLPYDTCLQSELHEEATQIFRWFKFTLTLKPPNSMACGNFFLAIWDTSHWNFFVKFGLKTPYDIS